MGYFDKFLEPPTKAEVAQLKVGFNLAEDPDPVIRVGVNTDYGHTEFEKVQLEWLIQAWRMKYKLPDDWEPKVFVNTNALTYLAHDKWPIFVTGTPYLTKFVKPRGPGVKMIKALRLKWTPGGFPPLEKAFRDGLRWCAEHNVYPLITPQRFKKKELMYQYVNTPWVHYGKRGNQFEHLYPLDVEKYSDIIDPSMFRFCNEKETGCVGCMNCALLTYGMFSESATLLSLDLSASLPIFNASQLSCLGKIHCHHACPGCFAAAIVLQVGGYPAVDQLKQNAKQAAIGSSKRSRMKSVPHQRIPIEADTKIMGQRAAGWECFKGVRPSTLIAVFTPSSNSSLLVAMVAAMGKDKETPEDVKQGILNRLIARFDEFNACSCFITRAYHDIDYLAVVEHLKSGGTWPPRPRKGLASWEIIDRNFIKPVNLLTNSGWSRKYSNFPPIVPVREMIMAGINPKILFGDDNYVWQPGMIHRRIIRKTTRSKDMRKRNALASRLLSFLTAPNSDPAKSSRRRKKLLRPWKPFSCDIWGFTIFQSLPSCSPYVITGW